MDIKDLRYIVFLITPEFSSHLNGKHVDKHEGEIFVDLETAQEYANSSVIDGFCSRFIIGVFALEKDAERMGISKIETYGFRNDRKNVNQLDLFN